MRIAALDDDPLQLELLQQVATEAGHSCHSYLKGAALQQALRRESFDLLLIDWELPDVKGPDIVRWVREQISKEVPVIFVTHRSEEADIVEGLACGADDFMIKPVRAGELRARISALLRRAYPLTAQSVLDFGPYRFLTATNGIEMEGKPVEVTHREYTLALTRQGTLLVGRGWQVIALYDSGGAPAAEYFATGRTRAQLALRGDAPQFLYIRSDGRVTAAEE